MVIKRTKSAQGDLTLDVQHSNSTQSPSSLVSQPCRIFDVAKAATVLVVCGEGHVSLQYHMLRRKQWSFLRITVCFIQDSTHT